MQREYTSAQFVGQDVHVGIDVARKQWKVAVLLGQDFHKRMSVPPEPGGLVQYLQRTFPGARLHTVYEAGYFGFWIHEALVKHGVDSMVVNPADVPTSDKERRTKTDRVDAFKLARSLSNGELRRIYIPDRRSLEDRTLVRMRSSFVRKQTRCKCQIKALLRFYNIEHSDDLSDRYWSAAYIRWLEQLKLTENSGTIALQMLLKELASLRETITALTKQIRSLGQQDLYRKRTMLLTQIPGISQMAAVTFLTEIISLDRFKNLDRLASFVGLVPGEHSTGETERDTGLTPRRNTALRYMLIECAWIAQREDPALLQAFTEYAKRMPKNVAIVHIARKLLSRMRFVLKHQQPYVSGVISTT
jgi:transposase